MADAANDVVDDTPSRFLCPVSFAVMRRPVRLVETGKVYDERSIADWFALGKNTCPSTGQRLVNLDYEPEVQLKFEIDQWIASTGWTEEQSAPVPAPAPVVTRVRPIVFYNHIISFRNNDVT